MDIVTLMYGYRYNSANRPILLNNHAKIYIVTEKSSGETVETDADLLFLFGGYQSRFEEYFMVFAGMDGVLGNKDLNGTDWRVLMLLCTSMKQGGWIELSHESISKSLCIARPNISKSLKRIECYGYIERVRRENGKLCLRLKPEIAGRGRFAIHNAQRAIANIKLP